jgi:L-rhamnose mutarotase
LKAIFTIFIALVFLSCNSTPQEQQHIRRFGQVIKVKREKLEYYRELHAHPWPCVLERIKEANIRNYSIFLQDTLLFAYFEYVGSDFEADMKKIAADTCTQRWWKETDPCQESLDTSGKSWWLNMEEVFFTP